MPKLKIALLSFLFLLAQNSFSQTRYTLSGYVKDSASGETLIGATITINGQGRGVNTNQYGFFSLTLVPGSYNLACSYVGYQAQQKTIELNKSQSLGFLLPPNISTNTEVVVLAKRRDNNVKTAQMGKIDLSMSQVKAVPVIFGEVDILKTLQLLPG